MSSHQDELAAFCRVSRISLRISIPQTGFEKGVIVAGAFWREDRLQRLKSSYSNSTHRVRLTCVSCKVATTKCRRTALHSKLVSTSEFAWHRAPTSDRSVSSQPARAPVVHSERQPGGNEAVARLTIRKRGLLIRSALKRSVSAARASANRGNDLARCPPRRFATTQVHSHSPRIPQWCEYRVISRFGQCSRQTHC